MGKSCSGARCSEPGWAQERKEKFFWIQRGRLAPKVRSGEACFGFEVDGGKAWRGRLAGALGGRVRV